MIEDTLWMRIKLYLLFINIFSIALSQNLLLTDNATGKPIPYAYVYHENESDIAQSNEEGIVPLSAFKKGLIFIQHPSYHDQSVAYLGSDISLSLQEKIISYDEVVISANKWEQQEENISQEIISINRREIAFENPQTSADLLISSGQVFVQKSQLGGGSPKLRGFAANGVLLVVDGVRMNNAIFRGGNLQNVINIDANAIESTEVVFGPGSVIYGSDALGGVMDFHTIDPLWSNNETNLSGNALLRYSSAANERTGHIDFSIARNKLTFFHSTSLTNFDDLMAGSIRSKKYERAFERTFYAERKNGEDQLVPNSDFNLQRFSGYNLFSTINKLKFRINEDLDVSYGFYFSNTSDIPRYDRLTEPSSMDSDSLVNAEWYYGPQKWMMHRIQAVHYQKNTIYNQLKITGAFQQFEESRHDRKFGSNSLRSRTEKVDMYSLSIDLDKELSKGDLFYGLDFYFNNVDSDGIRKDITNNIITPTTSRYPSNGSKYTSAAIYGSYIHRFNEKVSINAGARFNYVGLTANTLSIEAESVGRSEIDLANNALTGSFGLTYNFHDDQKIRYNISTGFRAPNVDDVGKLFELNDHVIIVPNADLKPEHTISNELGYEFKKENLLFELTGFYSRLKDAIVRGDYEINGDSQIDGFDIRAQVNAGRAEIYGFSTLIHTEINQHFAIRGTLSLTEGMDITNDQPLRHATPVFGKASLIHKKNKIRAEFSIDFNGNRRPSQIPDSELIDKAYLYTENGSPAWYTLNIKSSYQLNEKLKLNIGVENMLDQHYRPYTSGISAPGRNYLIALRGTI